MKRLLVVFSIAFCLFVPTASALAAAGQIAYNPLSGACKAGANTSSACDPSVNGSDPISGSHGALKRVTSLIAIIAGIAAVIVLIIGGLQYITSAGDPQKATSARSMIFGAVIGLIIIVAAQSILLFVLSKV